MKRNHILIVAGALIALAAIVGWMSMYQYCSTGHPLCVQRINRLTHAVEVACRGQEWKRIGEKRAEAQETSLSQKTSAKPYMPMPQQSQIIVDANNAAEQAIRDANSLQATPPTNSDKRR